MRRRKPAPHPGPLCPFGIRFHYTNFFFCCQIAQIRSKKRQNLCRSRKFKRFLWGISSLLHLFVRCFADSSRRFLCTPPIFSKERTSKKLQIEGNRPSGRAKHRQAVLTATPFFAPRPGAAAALHGAARSKATRGSRRAKPPEHPFPPGKRCFFCPFCKMAHI